jgi:hypothetical protein
MRALSVLGLILAIGAMPLDRAAAPPRAYHKSLSWANESGSTARALVFGEFSRDTSVTRVLLEAPGAARAVLTHEDFPARGITVSRLTEDATGWWAELREASGLTFKDVEESSIAWNWVEKWSHREYPVTWTLSGRDFPPFAAEGSTHDNWFVDLFLTRMRSAGEAAKPTARLPLQLGQTLRFLAGVESRRQADEEPGSALIYFRDLIEVLDRLATDRERLSAPAASYRLESGAMHRGLQPESESDRSLIARFRSIRAEDPLAGIHVREAEARALQGASPEHR